MEKLPLPALGQHCVRLKMLAAPVNPADINMLQGTEPLGADILTQRAKVTPSGPFIHFYFSPTRKNSSIAK